MKLGSKIRELRLVDNLTQSELADRCELTKGYISQIENDLTSPSISTLADILAALGTTLKEFFDETEKEKLVFKKEDYFIKDNGDGQKIVWLVPNSQKNEMEPIIIELEPGVSTTLDMPHEGQEFGYVLEGKIRLHIGKSHYVVKKGESFYYITDRPHYLRNHGDRVAKVIWISSPPNF